MDRCVYNRKLPLHRLENIEEEGLTNWFLATSSSLPPPETPTEPMEFLARSWSLSALELSKALRDFFPQSQNNSSSSCCMNTEKKDTSSRASVIAEMVPRGSATNEKVPTVPDQHVTESLGSDSESCRGNAPTSIKNAEDKKEWLQMNQTSDQEFLFEQRKIASRYKHVARGKTVGGWMKEQKEKRKEELRTQNAQLHAATSVAAVAAAIAAIVAANVSMSDASAAPRDGPSKISAAIAAAAALVASHCVEIAEEMGAGHDRILAVITSAVNVKTSGDIMTLTAGAATALRAAAALRARLHKGMQSASLAPCEESAVEERLSDVGSALNLVVKGGELLKRTRKGSLHWKVVSLYMNSNCQVIIKMKSKHMAGTIAKKKKSVVFAFKDDITPWIGREEEQDSEQQKAYFGIQTADRLIEFECRNESEKKMWAEGIKQMLHSGALTKNVLHL